MSWYTGKISIEFIPRLFVIPPDFDPETLLRRQKKQFWLFLALAAILHLSLVLLNPFKPPFQKPPRPLTVAFIKRQPRLTKPLGLRKIPQPKRQLMYRQVRLGSARMDQVQALLSLGLPGVMGTKVELHPNQPGTLALGPMGIAGPLEPGLVASPISISHTPEHKIDLALEMLDVNSMDTGRYRAIVAHDPHDRQAIKGFIKIAPGLSYKHLAWEGTGVRVQELDLLVDAINEYTGLQAELVDAITYDDKRLLEIPLLVLPMGRPNETEKENLVRYLLGGGFIMGGLSYIEEEIFEGLEKYGGLVRGKEFWTEQLPENHPIHSAFFDMRGGTGRKYLFKRDWVQEVYGMVGYFIKGRLVGIDPISGSDWSGHEYDRSSTRELMFAINVVVYALTQEGSIAHRLMQQGK